MTCMKLPTRSLSLVSLLVGLLASTSIALAAPGADLLAQGRWQYSADCGLTWTDTPPILPTVKDVLVKITFTAAALPEGTRFVALTENLKPYDGYTVTPFLNGNELRGPLGDMLYRNLYTEPDRVKVGENVVMFRVQLWSLEYRWKKLDPAPLKMTAELRPIPQEDFAIQTGPLLGALGTDYFTVTCRTNMPAAVTVEVTDAATGKPAGMLQPPSHGYIHRFKIAGLSPDTQYNYAVKARLLDTKITAASEPGAVRTFPAAGTPAASKLRFVAAGDSRSRPEEWKRVAAAIAKTDARLVVFGGDMTAFGLDDALWDSGFFGPADGLFARLPFYPVQGNHEEDCSFYREIFYTPCDGGRSTNWAQSIGNVLLIGIDGAEDWSAGGENARWLEQTLANAKEGFVFLATHYPAYTSAGHGRLNDAGQPAERTVLQAQTVILPLMEKYHATAMLAGHDHIYERSEPPGGVPVIITGGAGAPPAKKLDTAEKQNPYSKVFVDSLHYAILDVNGDTCAMTVLTPEGKEIDARTFKARKPEAATAPAGAGISRTTTVDLLASCR